MSNPVRAEDREHFSIVRESLARDGLHVAMVAHDRDRLHDYALALARTLAAPSGVRVEAYHPDRLEALVVDLMLHRFDAALSDISRPAPGHGAGWPAAHLRPGCVLFVDHAESLPRGEWRQLLRVAAGTRRNGLRLVALFDASRASCDERIADMGTQVARWDLDADEDHPSERVRANNSDGAAKLALLPRISRRSQGPRIAANGRRWLAAAGIAVVVALLPALLPAPLPALLSNADSSVAPNPLAAAASGTMTYAVKDQMIGATIGATAGATAGAAAGAPAGTVADMVADTAADVPAGPVLADSVLADPVLAHPVPFTETAPASVREPRR